MATLHTTNSVHAVVIFALPASVSAPGPRWLTMGHRVQTGTEEDVFAAYQAHAGFP